MKKNIIKLFALLLSAVVTLCSCGAAGEAASNIVSAVVSSAGEEISNAVSEGLDEFSDGMDEFRDGMEELKDGLKEAQSGIAEAGDIVSDHIDNIADDIGSKLSDELEDIPEGINSLGSSVSEEIGNIADDIADNIGSELSDAADEIVPASSVSADDTTKAPETASEKKQYTFRNKTRYDEHYKKHGAEFGDITKEEYLELANELINSDSDRVLHKYSDDGDYMYFDQDTNYFLVLSEDGYIRTFFIPSAGINYWNRQ